MQRKEIESEIDAIRRRIKENKPAGQIGQTPEPDDRAAASARGRRPMFVV